MKKFYLIFLNLFVCFIYIGCNTMFKDDELSLPRESYNGNAIRFDGYYYHHQTNSTSVFFLYRNGIMLGGMSFAGVNIDAVEKEMIKYYYTIENAKYHWRIFMIRENILEAEGWRSIGWTAKLPVYKFYYNIENDTTLLLIKEINLSDRRETQGSEIYHFRQFISKPDSISKFIK